MDDREQPDLRHRSVAVTIGHIVVQLASLAIVAGLAYCDRIDGITALVAIGGISGYQGLQALRGRPPTALAFALLEGLRIGLSRYT